MVTNFSPRPIQASLKLMIVALLAAILLSLSFQSSQAQASEDATTEEVTLAVENMTCSLCPYTVRKSLQQVEGVVDAQVDFGNKTATVVYDSQKTGVKALTQATTHAGYPSSLKE